MEQPGIVGQQRQPGAPLLVAPADMVVAPAQMQRRGGPERQPEPLAGESGHIAHLLAHGGRRVQVVVFDQESVEARLLLGGDQAHLQCCEHLLFVWSGTSKTWLGVFHAVFCADRPPDVPLKVLSP